MAKDSLHAETEGAVVTEDLLERNVLMTSISPELNSFPLLRPPLCIMKLLKVRKLPSFCSSFDTGAAQLSGITLSFMLSVCVRPEAQKNLTHKAEESVPFRSKVQDTCL